MSDNIHPKWEALTDEGKVVATWIEKPGTYQDPDWIRKCRDMYYPGHPLRVTKMVPVSHMDGEGEPGILVLPPNLELDPDFMLNGTMWTVTAAVRSQPGEFGVGPFRETELCPGVGYGISERPHPHCLTPLDFHPAHGVTPPGDHPDAASRGEGLEDLESP